MAVPVAAAVNPMRKRMENSSSLVPMRRWEVWGINWSARERKVRRKVRVAEEMAHRWEGVGGMLGGVKCRCIWREDFVVWHDNIESRMKNDETNKHLYL